MKTANKIALGGATLVGAVMMAGAALADCETKVCVPNGQTFDGTHQCFSARQTISSQRAGTPAGAWAICEKQHYEMRNGFARAGAVMIETNMVCSGSWAGNRACRQDFREGSRQSFNPTGRTGRLTVWFSNLSGAIESKINSFSSSSNTQTSTQTNSQARVQTNNNVTGGFVRTERGATGSSWNIFRCNNC